MKFEPRTPRDDVNVSPTHPLREAFELILRVSALFALALALIAWSVDIVVALVPPETEARVFSSLWDDDPALGAAGTHADEVQRAQETLDRLVAHWPEAAYDFRVREMRSPHVNAAAMPGGVILVTSEFLEKVRAEEELAFVLGHELGHFQGRHHLRRLGRGFAWTLGLAVLLGSGAPAPDVGHLVAELTARGFDREQESKADAFGLELVYAEYGAVGSSLDFFERLEGDGFRAEGLAAYLSTHPTSSERIEALKQLARDRGWLPADRDAPGQSTDAQSRPPESMVNSTGPARMP